MNKLLHLFQCLMAVGFLFAGCASEITAPTEPVIPTGTIHPMDDAFLASISETGHCFVYTPPNYDADRADAYPTVYMLNGFSGDENYFIELFSAVDAADWLLSRGEIEPMILVFLSGHSAMGGSFYTDSPHPTVLHSERHILDIAAAVDGAYNTVADPSGRAVFGHSMGGFGAVSVAMNNPALFGSIGALAGPLSFWGTKTAPPHADTTYKGLEELLPSVLKETSYDAILAQTRGIGDIAEFQRLMAPSAARRVTTMIFAMAAAFSPTNPLQPTATTIAAYSVDLPIGIDGRLEMTTWTRWMAFDPVSRFNQGQAVSLSYKNLFLDAGAEDELGLNNGHQIFAGAIQPAASSLAIHLTHYETYESILDAQGGIVKADHTAMTYERLKVYLKWQSEQF